MSLFVQCMYILRCDCVNFYRHRPTLILRLIVAYHKFPFFFPFTWAEEKEKKHRKNLIVNAPTTHNRQIVRMIHTYDELTTKYSYPCHACEQVVNAWADALCNSSRFPECRSTSYHMHSCCCCCYCFVVLDDSYAVWGSLTLMRRMPYSRIHGNKWFSIEVVRNRRTETDRIFWFVAIVRLQPIPGGMHACLRVCVLFTDEQREHQQQDQLQRVCEANEREPHQLNWIVSINCSIALSLCMLFLWWLCT